MLLARARLLVVTIWAGSLWTVGYLVAPTLFGTLDDRGLAGKIAGLMFRSEAWLSIACGVAMLGLLGLGKDLDAKLRRNLMIVVVVMLVCMAVSHFGIHPMMLAVREAAGPGGIDAAGRSRLGMLHGVSMVFYVIQSLLAVWLVIKNPRT